MSENSNGAYLEEERTAKVRREASLKRPEGESNPNNIYIEEEVDEKVRVLTHLTPNHVLDPNDVFLVGYMKSGTTWFRNLIAGVVYGLTSEYVPFAAVWELIPNHGPRKPYYKRYQTPTYFKSHDFPRPQYLRVVYLMRDGRDVVVSLAHHMKNVYKQDVDMLELVKGRHPIFSARYEWYKHVESWLANPYNAEMIIIKYEDLKKDPLPELRRFCKFAGIERDDALLEKAVAFASFENMRERETRLGIDYRTWPKDKFFVRKGQVGSHKEEMPPEILEKFMRKAAGTLSKVGYL